MSIKKSEGMVASIAAVAKELGSGTSWGVASSGNYWNRVEVEEDPWEQKEEQDSFRLPEEDRW